MTCIIRRMSAIPVLLCLAGCGGGGDAAIGGSTGPVWSAGVFQPSANFVALCVSPRAGTDPDTNRPYPDRRGTVANENNWLRSWTNETYLWYDEVPDLNPANYPISDYFDLLKTSAVTVSGTPKDQFHFTYDTAAYRALSQSGVSAGYGAQWAILADTPPRSILVAYTEPGSPATQAGLARGAEVLTVDGIDVVSNGTQAGIDAIYAALYPSAAGQSHNFTVRDRGGSTTRSFSLQSANVTSAPVQNVSTISTATGNVGYMLFNDHIATAEAALVSAVQTLRTASIHDLVLDIRYNGGGYLAIAGELAYMIAGPTPTAGQIFERLTFSAKHPTVNPVTGETLEPFAFPTTTLGYSSNSGQSLPTLDLQRLYVLTSADTCSASESIINSLRGVGVEVIEIGSTTCGKPYGFYPEDNCGTTYFSIQFKGVNNLGFGDYTDGFSPANATVATGVPLPGCSVGDDYTHELGDPNERRLAAALGYRATQFCPAPSGFAPHALAATGPSKSNFQGAAMAGKAPWRLNRILLNPRL